jgi:hypothetical protein
VLEGVLPLLLPLLPLSTVLLLTMLLRDSSVVNDAVTLVPFTQAVGVSAVPSTK